MESFWTAITEKLESLEKKSLLRQTKTYEGLDFCSNDYLGLATNESMLKKFQECQKHFSYGSTAARLVRGNRDQMFYFESKFANFVNGEAALLTNTGFSANQGLLDAIVPPKAVVLTDRLNHASILDGIRIAKANKKYYNHNDLDMAESILQKLEIEDPSQKLPRFWVTESLFSMDGDGPDLQRILQLKKKYGFILILDEAHALGVYGIGGRGLAHTMLPKELISEIDYRVYTLGKSMGLFGGMVVTKKIGREHLVNTMRSFIFSTALPPYISEMGTFALDLVESMDKEREQLLENARYLSKTLQDFGFHVTEQNSHIIPVLLSSEEEALSYSRKLSERGLDVRAIRPPTVPSPRLRISLNCNRTRGDIQALVDAMIEIRKQM